MRNWTTAIPSQFLRIQRFLRDPHNIQPVKFTMMFSSLQTSYHLIYQIINIEQFQLHRWVIHRIRQIIRNSIAERCNSTIIIRPTPFTKKIRETIYHHTGTSLLAIFKKQLLTSLLATSILTIPETTGQRCLLRTAKHHRTTITMFLQRIQQGTGKAEIPLHELLLVLRPIYPS